MYKGIKSGLLATFLSVTAFAQAAPSPNTVIIPAPPSVNARSFVLMEADTGKVLVSQNQDKSYAPASLTKLMTSYIVDYEVGVGRMTLNDQVPISVKAWKAPGSRMFVREGKTVKLEDLLRGIIIQSGNDASVAAAEYVAGSEAAFADLMNQHAQRIGMKNSKFKNATGLPAKDHYSSAYDLALLGRSIVKDFPEQYKIYGEKSFTYNNIKQNNRNKLLFRDSNVDGMKTGWTEDAGYCMVASSKRDGMRLITVVMDTASPNARAQESQKLLAYGFRFFEKKNVFSAQKIIETSKVWGGVEDNVSLGTQSDVTLVTYRGVKLKTEIAIDEGIEAPIQKGDVLGNIKVFSGDELIQEVPLTALEDIEEAGFFKRLWDSLVRFFSAAF